MQPGVAEAAIKQMRATLNACATSPEIPGTCWWEAKLSNRDASSGTVSWRLDPADPAATAALPSSWLASGGYKGSVTLAYITVAWGDCWLWGVDPCYFTDAINDRRTLFEIDLSGEAVAVRMV